MPSVTFASGTVITSAWLNDVNTEVYSLVNVKDSDFGAEGDGVTEDSIAVQQAVTYAATQLIEPGGNSTSSTGAAVYFPPGSYLISSKVNVTEHGVALLGDDGKGPRILGNNIVFDIGDYTDTRRIDSVNISGLTFVASTTSNATACIKLYRATKTTISNVNFYNWYVGIDTYRASTTYLSQIRGQITDRTTNALGLIRMQGTNETTEAYTPGGGIHLTDIEYRGNVDEDVYSESGIILHSCDGFYATQIHITGCEKSININPLATAANHTITDIYFNQCYFDEPIQGTDLDECLNVKLGGSVAINIAMASGGTRDSVYGKIHFNSCYLRGGDQVRRCFVTQVSDPGGAWFADGRYIEDIQFVGGAMRQATITAAQIYGASSGEYTEASVSFIGTWFAANNSSGTANASAIVASGQTLLVSGCSFTADTTATDYIIQATLSAVGAGDSATPSFTCIGNNFAFANPLIKDVNYTSVSGARITIANNTHAGSGQTLDQTFASITTNATPTVTWSYVIPSGACGNIVVDVVGQEADGDSAQAYQFYAGYRRNGAGSSLSTGTTSFTSVRSWNPDSLASVPTATLVSNTLTITVTGVAATTIYWVTKIRLTQAR